MKRTKTPHELFTQVERIFGNLPDRSEVSKTRAQKVAKSYRRYVDNIYIAAGMPNHAKSSDTEACNRVFNYGAYPVEIYAAK